MTVEMNGIAHIQLSVNDADRCLPFWERLCHFFEMTTLIKGEGVLYCIGSRTGILVRATPADKRDTAFDQDRAGLHHFCFRARAREDVDAVHRFITGELAAHVIHPPEEENGFAPGYYSVLFEDPDGIRVEVNHVPGKGHFGPEGRLGSGAGAASTYGPGGLGPRPGRKD
jgi:catechol 2,3-dioxygenase-like lactoylglutathione lyase family enzyme